MRRLTYVVLFTGRFAQMKAFYGRQIGLAMASADDDEWVEYDTGGARIALHRMDDPDRNGMVLRFEANDLDADVAAMASRGVEFVAPPRDYPWGRFAEFSDPEGNPVGLLQPVAARPSHAVEIDRVVLSCSRFLDTAHFYREKVGLKPTVDTDRWVEFNTGETRLALHPRRRDVDHPPHTEQNVTIVLGSGDLMAWVEDMRAREVLFATAPIEEDFGLYAEAADPDGYMVVFREPPPPVSLEEELAEAFEEEDAPHQVAIRKPPQKPSRAGGLIAGLQKRSRREADELRREREAARPPAPVPKKLDVVAPRGTGAAGARQKPKTQHDPKRAKAKPAIGSLMEAGRQTFAAKQRSVARTSKAAPVKSAARRPAKAAPGEATKRALQRVMNSAPKRSARPAAKTAVKRAPKAAAKRGPKAAGGAPKRAVKRAAKRTVKRAVRRK
jgi:predicted enzyme related to lactoylglutathione lyase